MTPLLVFDLDGTLAETAPDLVAALNVTLAGAGIPRVPYEAARKLVGFGGRALICDAVRVAGLPAPDEDRIETLFSIFLAHYEAHIAEGSHLYEGVARALDRFAEAGWRFAVCTNKYEHPAIQLLTALGIADRFAAICGQNTFAVCKPDAGALLETIARAGGTPGRRRHDRRFQDGHRHGAQCQRARRRRRLRLFRRAHRQLWPRRGHRAFRPIVGRGRTRAGGRCGLTPPCLVL